MPHATQPFSSVPLILSSAEGESLLMMAVARSLRLSGIVVSVFGQQINNMRSWVPRADIEPELRLDAARAWRSGWRVGQVPIGSSVLPTGRLKERYWKYMVSVRKVLEAFDRLRALTSNA
jgi:hypothetical protein